MIIEQRKPMLYFYEEVTPQSLVAVVEERRHVVRSRSHQLFQALLVHEQVTCLSRT